MQILSDTKYQGEDTKISASCVLAEDKDGNNVDLESYLKELNGIIVDYTLEDSSTTSKTFDVDIQPGEICDFYICGFASANTDLKMVINSISSYGQCCSYRNGTLTASGDLSGSEAYATSDSCFYRGMGFGTTPSIIHGTMCMQKNSSDVYYPTMNWHSINCGNSRQYVSQGGGIARASITSISSITFGFTSSTACFTTGTRIIIKKRR